MDDVSVRVLGGVPPPEPDLRDGLRRHPLRRPACPTPRRRGAWPGSRRSRAAADAAQAIPEDTLTVEDRITRGMLALLADLAERDEALGAYEIRAVDQIYGPQTLLPQVATFQHGRHARAARARGSTGCARTGRSSTRNIEILHEARASGRTSARIVAERTIDQLERPRRRRRSRRRSIPALSKVASDEDRERVREVVRDVVYPADRRYLEALSGEYLAATREQPGLVSAPDGDALYRYCDPSAGRRSTLEPRDVHQVGLDELATIDDERRAIAQRRRATATTSTAYRAVARRPIRRTSPRPSRSWSRARRGHRAGRRRSRRGCSARLPQAGCIVKPGRAVQGEGRAVRVLLPADDRRHAARHLLREHVRPAEPDVLTSSPRRRSTRRSPATTSRSRSRWSTRTLNVFRRLGARFVAGAYVEGWGLYAERLADELGLYRNDAERLGMLDAQAWRASRLIVDSGMHGLGWSRQQSIDWLLKTGLSETDADHRDRPLHRVARPGAHLHDRDARDPAAAPGARGPRRRPRSTSRGSTTSSSGTARCRSSRSPAELPGWVKPSA